MDQNFQTSFIPKKPMIEEPIRNVSRPISVFLVFSIFIFITMLLATGGLYFYQGILEKNIAQMKVDLEKAKNRFELSKITELQTLDKRLKASTEILKSHVAVSPIFDALSKITIKTIRYTKFSYAFDNTDKSKVLIKMSGQASWTQGYKAIALQSDIFSGDNEYKKLLIDPVFSGLTPDTKGNILFDLDFSVDRGLVDYNKMIQVDNTPVDNSATDGGVVN